MPNDISNNPSPARPRRNWPFVLCLVIGILLLVFDLVLILPVYIPRSMGYQTFFITTGSMDPVIPTGSIAYFKAADPATLQPGEVIAYTNSDGIVVVHRIKTNVPEQKYLQAKGDNNKVLDRDRITYDHVHGIYAGFIPGIGKLMYFMHSAVGRILQIIIAVAGAVLVVPSAVILAVRRRRKRQ